MAGPTTNPRPMEAPTAPSARMRVLGPDRSTAYAWATAIEPPQPPATARASSSVTRPVAIPDRPRLIAEPVRLASRTRRRPYRSESDPSTGEAKNWAAEYTVSRAPTHTPEPPSCSTWNGSSGRMIPKPIMSTNTARQTTNSDGGRNRTSHEDGVDPVLIPRGPAPEIGFGSKSHRRVRIAGRSGPRVGRGGAYDPDMNADDAGLARFNSLGAPEAADALRACCAAPGWVDAVVDGRPYPNRVAVAARADEALAALDWAGVRTALDAHPRIGGRANGGGREASWSRSEQSGMDTATDDVRSALAEANRAYEERFGHVFLIFATGRADTEMLAAAQQRLGNDEEVEHVVVRGELGRIVGLRLAKLLDSLGRAEDGE